MLLVAGRFMPDSLFAREGEEEEDSEAAGVSPSSPSPPELPQKCSRRCSSSGNCTPRASTARSGAAAYLPANARSDGSARRVGFASPGGLDKLGPELFP